MDSLGEFDQKKENQYLRLKVMQSLIATGAARSQVVDVIAKMYRADHEDYEDETVEKEVETIARSFELVGELAQKRNMQADVEAWISSNKSNKDCDKHVTISLRDCYSDLHLSTINEKTACRMAFRRLLEKGKLEQIPNRPGLYRSLNNGLTEIDFLNVDTTPFHVRWPLNVHEYVEIYPKSLIVIAGAPNAGKTAFLLNVARKNMKERNDIVYFSSEMGAAELNIRLRKFNGMTLQDWTKIKFIEKSSDFKDVINPNGFNIIDYFEVTKDFYEIGGRMTEIFNVLDKGIAVIAIQKPKGRDTGIGGERTLDKARLYMSIEDGVLKIVKAKLWRQEFINPNGLWCKFSLGGGATFKTMPDPATGDEWRKPVK